MFNDPRMSTPEPVTQPEPSVTRLVSGIVDDAHDLVRQQIQLLKHEILRDLKEARRISISFAVSCVSGGVALLLLSFMLVYLVNWLWPSQPLWVGFAFVGGLCAVTCVGLFFFAKERLEEIAPISEEALNATKENLQWTRKPR
jgi:hypothetical protein